MAAGHRIRRVGPEVVHKVGADHKAPVEAVRTVQEEAAVRTDPAVRRVDRKAVRKEKAARRGSTADQMLPTPPC